LKAKQRLENKLKKNLEALEKELPVAEQMINKYRKV
jgi:hypothetical protein